MPFVAPALITPQGAGHPDFVHPPLDGSCTLVEAYDWHLKHSPEHEMYRFGESGSVTWRDGVRAVYRAARLVRALAADAERPSSVAVLAVADCISVATLVGGLMRAGHAPFLPSPRVSPAVLRDMIDKAGVTHMFCSRDAATAKLARETVAQTNRAITVLQLPTFEQLFDDDQDAEAPPPVHPDIYDTAVVIHSSGSTATPKLLPLSFSTFANIGIAPWNHEFDIGSAVMNFSALPMYHIMGLLHLAFAAYCGTTIAVFPPSVPPVVARPETLLESSTATRSTAIYIMPSILETISLVPEQVAQLSKLDLVMYGGAPLNAVAGDRLVAGGVKLTVCYGMSEMGVVSAMFYKSAGRDWQWIRLATFSKCHFRDLGDGTQELVVISHDGYHVDTPNCEVDGQPAIATKDVVVRHPTDPSLFRTVGRLDDQIVLSTGEKTNAIPLEAILHSDPRIEFAVMFGRSRPHNGVIILPISEYAFDPSNPERLDGFREAIWPTVEKMNRFAPSHSRLEKQMILVASPAKPFIINETKRIVVRPRVVSTYAGEIKAAYDAFDRAADPIFPPPASWGPCEALPFVRKIVQNIMRDVENDNDDLIDMGCDSMKAALIHNQIIGALLAAGVSIAGVPADVVYKYPTIANLAHFASATGLGTNLAANAAQQKVNELEHLLAKHTQSFPAHAPAAESRVNGSHTGGSVFLVTGTTGGLGSNLLAQLLTAPGVLRVFALNRPGFPRVSPLDKHLAVFADRGLDAALLERDSLVLLEGDTSREDLGLPLNQYEELRRSVTHIYHNAWPVNFNYAVKSFEPAVRGARHLVDLALKSTRRTPPHFIFISSISVSRNVSANLSTHQVPEAAILDAGDIIGLGYAESKWIVERMLQAASERTPLQTLSVRVGQLAGGINACWNASDWVPVIARSAAALGCLPECPSDIAWIRLHEAAASLLEMRDARGVLHLVHPRPVPWREMFSVFSQATGVPLVSFQEWMSRLSDYGSGGISELPALRLLEFWKSLGDAGFTTMSAMEHISSSLSQDVSPVLSDMSPLTDADAEAWLAYWRRSGFLS
ncbi:acetyl-CoA synthetase-like protein [Auricularia subglabra TFB-10046 SS5]|nr:acetyl-CoA synthetase-like protein [Auricularia subglabra TFB-10046 SS5]